MNNRLWEQSHQAERLGKLRKVYDTYVLALDKEKNLDARQEAIMETLGYILLDNDQLPEKYEDDEI